jgi:hypothetical protein
VGGAQAPVAVLDQVQVLDQEVAAARAVAQQRADLVEGRRLDHASLRCGAAWRRPEPGWM